MHKLSADAPLSEWTRPGSWVACCRCVNAGCSSALLSIRIAVLLHGPLPTSIMNAMLANRGRIDATYSISIQNCAEVARLRPKGAPGSSRQIDRGFTLPTLYGHPIGHHLGPFQPLFTPLSWDHNVPPHPCTNCKNTVKQLGFQLEEGLPSRSFADFFGGNDYADPEEQTYLQRARLAVPCRVQCHRGEKLGPFI